MTDPGFTFAILADTHIQAPSGDLSSPFPVNALANRRARYAAELVCAHRPDFTVHLGDVVHPLSGSPARKPAMDEARRILAPLGPNLRFVPGNHDIGDKPSPGMPAKPSSPGSIRGFRRAFGPDRTMFRRKGAAFFLINSSLINSGLPEEFEQWRWLESALASAKGGRIFLFSHYPPFICHPDEDDHYDNCAEPGRARLLDLAARAGVDAMFSGHVHHFFYNRFKGMKLYCLPATSFARQDYAELFSIAPASEFGRDDPGKLAATFVDVSADGHRLRVVGTDGRGLDEGERAKIAPRRPKRIPLIPHLRHAWFEPRSLPYNGPMEEFSRKRARNDYPLLRLIQLGIESVRAPLADLFHPLGRRRIEDWIAAGRRFVFFKTGLPSRSELAYLSELGGAVAAIEALAARSDLSDVADGAAEVVAAARQPVWLGKITTSADAPRKDGVFIHAVSSGFPPSQAEAALEKLEGAKPSALVFQIEWGDDPAARLSELSSVLRGSGISVAANLRLADSNPAVANFDDVRIGGALRAALDAARKLGNVILQVDTFEDMDRGYSPRHGLVDRLCNSRNLL